MTTCPNCGADLSNKDKGGKGLIHGDYTVCLACKHVFKRNLPGKIKVHEQQPLDQMPLIPPDFVSSHKVGSMVACSDPRHPLFLEFGEVLKTEHIHIRVKFLNGKTIWMTEPIIERVPDEWIE